MANDLNLRVKRPQREIPESEWGWASEAASIASMIALSGLQEKTVAIEAEIDPSTLAKEALEQERLKVRVLTEALNGRVPA